MPNLCLTNAKPGMSTSDVLRLLVSENKQIAALFAFEYKHPALLQQRLSLSQDEEAILAKAAAVRTASRLPFWEALMLSCFGEQRDFTRLLSEATFHQSHRDSLLRI